MRITVPLQKAMVPIGTVHTWKDGKEYKKVSSSKWVPVLSDAPEDDQSVSDEQYAAASKAVQARHPVGTEFDLGVLGKVSVVAHRNEYFTSVVRENAPEKRLDVRPKDLDELARLAKSGRLDPAFVKDDVTALQHARAVGKVASLLVLYGTGAFEQPPEDVKARVENIMRSLALFTSANVQTVRDPAQFDTSKAYGKAMLSVGPYNVSFAPTREDYQRAHDHLKMFVETQADADATATPIYRGMRLSHETVVALQAGSTFPLHDISSFTKLIDKAATFASPNTTDVGKRGVIFVFDKPNRGSYINGLSGYSDEDEVITGGDVHITQVSDPFPRDVAWQEYLADPENQQSAEGEWHGTLSFQLTERMERWWPQRHKQDPESWPYKSYDAYADAYFGGDKEGTDWKFPYKNVMEWAQSSESGVDMAEFEPQRKVAIEAYNKRRFEAEYAETMKTAPAIVVHVEARTSQVSKGSREPIVSLPDPNGGDLQRKKPKYNRDEFRHKLAFKTKFQDIPISIENARNSYRAGTHPDGSPWRVKMQAHYGRIPRTVGADGDAVDVYLGPDRKSDVVFAVHQNDPKTSSYDETKIMLGWTDKDKARQAYLSHYNDPKFLGSITPVAMADFKQWLKEGARIGKRIDAPRLRKSPIILVRKKPIE